MERTIESTTAVVDHLSGRDQIGMLIQHAAHLLPSQGPIEVFVHHNTLHAFENHSFHDAVKIGLDRYGAHPYLLEQEYRSMHKTGRIKDEDLEVALKECLAERFHENINGLGTRGQIRLAMLRHPVHIGPDAELRWIVAETDALDRFLSATPREVRERVIADARQWLQLQQTADTPPSRSLSRLLAKFKRNILAWDESDWESFSLHLLWRVCREGIHDAHSRSDSDRFVRPRDLLLSTLGKDIDREVHDLLIRFCAAYVDQGYSDWALPHRDQGFFKAFLNLFSQSNWCADRWLTGLSKELKRLQRCNLTPEESIEESIHELGIPDDHREEFIIQSLLSLRGWAGMIWQLETGTEPVFHSIPPGSLAGMLAVQLILERFAILNIGRGMPKPSRSVSDVLQFARASLSIPHPMSDERHAFLLFQIAQTLGWLPQQLLALSETEWQELHDEIDAFSTIERRRIYHEAFERKYHREALDAFINHTRNSREKNTKAKTRRPDFQCLTCIDDREESFRRHLEEVHPACETFGAAGFFAVAIYYRGAADSFYKPLCPNVITPTNYVTEDVGYTFEGVHQERTKLRRKLGLASHLFQTHSRTFLGGMLAGIAGTLATAPLVASVLFPHVTARIRRRLGTWVQPPPVTTLQLERSDPAPGPDNGHVGFTCDEMANVVVRLLQDIGVTRPESFSRLFIICGHGSSSLNNPHESAYCCGACAGKRGGPNARAFARMANDWRVREKVKAAGISIPNDTYFVGAYHNTCDDSVNFFDLDLLPITHRLDFNTAQEAIEEARSRNAHERCRRFDSASLSISNREALRHVEGRAQDISQARPEYNHATNALCVVGRRDWSRGLFLDRRSFLASYDPREDDSEHSILARILAAAVPVCAGINLEYYFSRVDHVVYGSGSKLPHNIVSLLGVMEGTASDLRTGLYQQMVEIHEPLRILFVIEATAATMLSILERNASIRQLCEGNWIRLAVIDPEQSSIEVYRNGRFEPYEAGSNLLLQAASSLECYQGSRENRPFFSITKAEGRQ
ncbi:DUF2309 domain-containing protein [Blastopirellula marina]|uniref:Probable inorganic carbon transporter subunit DabA n=1 Tax=Blastopirellula marina TaxID=124 RepID=A0A2S8F9S5_9BACT|nr:DUF2309 domain-containing protein [Blastopirellula marina]PQO28899.1 DUF2309 domain-containing protein [Blastopirellula marina]PTL42172.1 DUF2309 domain-containing protein [Blastopirellula marina]